METDEKHDFHCTACDKQIVNLYDAKVHPLLEVLICKLCFANYGDGNFEAIEGGVDSNGDDEYCRWCADGGSLILCQNQISSEERCHKAYCEKCINRNFPDWDFQVQFKSPWTCFACDPKVLFEMRIRTTEIIRILTQPTTVNDSMVADGDSMIVNGDDSAKIQESLTPSNDDHHHETDDCDVEFDDAESQIASSPSSLGEHPVFKEAKFDNVKFKLSEIDLQLKILQDLKTSEFERFNTTFDNLLKACSELGTDSIKDSGFRAKLIFLRAQMDISIKELQMISQRFSNFIDTVK